MTTPDQVLIKHFSTPVPRPGPGPGPEMVRICTPAPGTNVPTAFDATGTLTAPDTNIQSCDVDETYAGFQLCPAQWIEVTGGNWTAHFAGLNDTGGIQVPLTARGNGGGGDRVWITVSNPPPGSPGTGTDFCISVGATDAVPQAALVQQQDLVPVRRYMIQHLRVKRRNPTRPGGYALRLEFRGTRKASFIVGGTLATPGDLVEKCFAGEHPAQRILNKDGEWQAVFENVLPGAHVLTVGTKAGVKDQAPILIEARE
jgi:hypothetical protein